MHIMKKLVHEFEMFCNKVKLLFNSIFLSTNILKSAHILGRTPASEWICMEDSGGRKSSYFMFIWQCWVFADYTAV